MTPALAPEQRHATPGPPPFAGITAEPRYMPPEGYCIAFDPDAPAKILTMLMEAWRSSPGEPVHIGRELGTGDVWSIHTIVEKLRRVGHRIQGERGYGGYIYRGCDPPPLYLHVEPYTTQVADGQTTLELEA